MRLSIGEWNGLTQDCAALLDTVLGLFMHPGVEFRALSVYT